MDWKRSLAWLTVVLVSTPLVVFLVPQFLGLDAYVVDSGSMAPTIPRGSVVYVTDVSVQTLDVGDIVVFRPRKSRINEQLVIHRITDTKQGNITREFRTKGDANVKADPGWTPSYRIEGTRVFSVPHLGRAVSLFESMPFLFFLLIPPATLLIRMEIRNLLDRIDDSESETKTLENFP